MTEENQADHTATKPGTTADSSPQVALATEQPVPSAPQEKTSQYVVTVDNKTGLLVKIEKLDEVTNERKELSQEEYERAGMSANLSSSPSEAGFEPNALPPSAESDPLLAAYYQGVADYFNALTSR
jgi:hypothetical protein